MTTDTKASDTATGTAPFMIHMAFLPGTSALGRIIAKLERSEQT